jgi:hypothetical protein
MLKKFLYNHRFTLILSLTVFLASCSSKCVEDSGNHIIKDLTVTPFNEIEISGPVKLVLRARTVLLNLRYLPTLTF